MHKSTKRKLMSGTLALVVALASTFTPVAAFAAPQSSSAIVEKAMGRIAGADRYETAAKISQAGWTQSEYAILSAGMDANLVDALTAAPLAKLKNAPILLTAGKELNSHAEAELKRLGVKTVYVTSGSGVITQPVLDRLKSLGVAVKPLGGANRFETAINIAKEMPKPTEIAVSTAYSNADALSVASIAAGKGMPILLTDAGELPENVKNYLNSVHADIQNSYVLGGTGAVSDTVKNALPNAVRLGGADRYATNIAILNEFAKDIQNRSYFVANGENTHLVDALTVSPLAAHTITPVVLTQSKMPQETQEFILLNLNTYNAIALGGGTVVPQAAIDELRAATVLSQDNETKGSADPLSPERFDNLKITGDNVTLKNAKVAHSVYIQGNNVTLENVEVSGTVFVDPGKDGSANLSGVTANNIVVLSGGESSIHLDVKANFLKVQSSNSVRVETKGNTQINQTVISSAAILDAVGGSIGKVEVQGADSADKVVEFRGKIGDVIVTGQVTIKAGAGAEITSLKIATPSADQTVALVGTFAKVEVEKAAKINIGANTTIMNMVTKAKADVTLADSTSKVVLLTDVGNTGSVVKDKDGNIQNTPSSPGSSGGGGGGGNNGNVSQAPLITALTDYAIVDNTAKTITIRPDENNKYTNLSLSSITVDKASTLELFRHPDSDHSYILGTWNLVEGKNSDLFTVVNLQKLNMWNTFSALKAANIDAFAVIDFTTILNAIKASPEKEEFYDNILPAALNIVEGQEAEVYAALDMCTIYNAADSSTKEKIEAALDYAVTQFNSVSSKKIELDNIIGKTSSSAFAEDMAKVNTSTQIKDFYKNIDFTTLVGALRDSQNKTAIYNAINFGQIFDAVKETRNYDAAAALFNAIQGLDGSTKVAMRDAINITELLAQMDSSSDFTIKLTAGGKTTTYTIVFASN